MRSIALVKRFVPAVWAGLRKQLYGGTQILGENMGHYFGWIKCLQLLWAQNQDDPRKAKWSGNFRARLDMEERIQPV